MKATNTLFKTRRSAFTLIEVLVAGSVLFIVSAAVVGLSNSIIQGTATTNVRTVTNLWAAEGLELVTKIREETVKAASPVNGEAVWFTPAYNSSEYGWYIVQESLTNPGKWQLTKLAVNPITTLDEVAKSASTAGSTLTSDTLSAARAICVEAIGAASDYSQGANGVGCNVNAAGEVINDGTRLNGGALCGTSDIYCQMTERSLARNVEAVAAPIIPSGNAVKVRSVVIWEDNKGYHSSDLATMLTNWRGYEQEL